MDEPFAEKRIRKTMDFDPSSTAVLVVDMLNDFLEDGGAMVMAEGRALYPPVRTLIERTRASRVPVIWICDEHPPFDKEFEKRVVHCLEGSWGAQIVDALNPQRGEYRVRKRRYSGFYETDLDLRLRELGIKHLIVTGIVTNICVRSTVHDAFFRGYDVIVPIDCVAATSSREQESTLYDIDTHYGTVTSLNAILETIERRGRKAVETGPSAPREQG